MLKDQFLKMVRELSYEKKEVTLSSGEKSDFYIDLKQTLLHPKGIQLASQLILEKLNPWKDKIMGVGGLTMGADPLVTGVSLESLNWHKPLMGFYIRKEPKGHGTAQWLEGIKNFKPSDRVVILEDVVTSGGSSLKAVERAELAGLKVELVITCVDRLQGGADKIRQKGYEFISLIDRKEIEKK